MTMQSIRPVFVLADQVIAKHPVSGKILVAQRWTGFTHGRHALCISTDDAVTGKQAGHPSEITSRFNAIRENLLPDAVTEEQARDHLAAQGRPRERLCGACTERLPLGALYCVRCGLPGGTPAQAVAAPEPAAEPEPAPTLVTPRRRRERRKPTVPVVQ